jgi:hypothetical protein
MESKDAPRTWSTFLPLQPLRAVQKIARNAPDLPPRISITRGHLYPFLDSHANVTGFLRLQE